MSLKVGIVGLPNVGKSTLFNALLKKRVALSANYPFATIEPNVGVVAVPDFRLERLAELVAKEEGMIPKDLLDGSRIKSGMTEEAGKHFPPLVPAVVQFVDIAGLVKGASVGAGLGNQFLSHIREVDAIIHVLRDFEDPNIVREGSENPVSDKLVIETELGLADLQTIEKLLITQDKEARITKDSLDQVKLEILNRTKILLETNGNLSEIKKDIKDREERIRTWFEKLPLLTIKPMLYVYNVSEEDLRFKIEDLRGEENLVVISAKVEEELADYSEEERKEYLHELGIEETGLERLIKKAYDLLGLMSFLTAGKKEIRAWTIKKGTMAPQAAGVIHTDFEKKFIRAEVIPYEKLLEIGSHTQAKQKGLLRTEGKEYIVQDGDVVEFLVGS